jgi:hypothetical protein
MLADPLVENRLPRQLLEADAIIDHGDAAARRFCRLDMRVPTRATLPRSRFAMSSLGDRIRL